MNKIVNKIVNKIKYNRAWGKVNFQDDQFNVELSNTVNLSIDATTSRDGKLYIIDGSSNYYKESDYFNLGNSSVKLVKEISDSRVKVIVDDDMFSPTAVYTINPKTNEIISEVRYSIKESDEKLQYEYNILVKNLKRGIVPYGIEDRRWVRNINPNPLTCEHKEVTKQGDGFTYVVCGKCGEDLL